MAHGPIAKFSLIKQFGQQLRDRGMNPNTMSVAEIETALRRSGANFTDSEGNYWGHAVNRDGKPVRVCIPA